MKLKLLKVTIAIGLTASSASAALYTITTGTGNAVNGFANSAGMAFQNNSTTGFPAGGVSVGIFSTDDFSTVTSASQLLGLFTVYSQNGIFSNAGPTGQRGTFALAGNQTIAGSAFDGKNIYVLVGNSPALADATEFAILKTNFTFSAGDDPTPTPITRTITAGNSQLLWGRQADDLKTTNTDASVNAGWQTAVLVPEPSALLLGALGALGLLRRRRI